MQQHRELPPHRHHRPFLGVLSAALGYLLAVSPEVGVLAEGPQDVVGAVDQQLPRQFVAVIGDAPLGITTSRSVGGWHQPQVRSHLPALRETGGIFEGRWKSTQTTFTLPNFDSEAT